MEVLPIDVTGLVATIMGISLVLIPVLGITARFALKPTVEALSRVFESRSVQDTVHILERRMALMEQQMESLEGSMRRLTEATDFHLALESGIESASPEDGSSDPHSSGRGDVPSTG